MTHVFDAVRPLLAWTVGLLAFLCGIALAITNNLVGGKRKALGVELPNVYASDITAKQDPKALAFNCAQRGAMNPHETYATALFGIVFGGLTYPLVAAAAGFGYGLGALLYYFGYASGDPSRRYGKGGLLMRLATVALHVLPFITAYKLLRT